MPKINLKEVGAITVVQPWAYLILQEGKNVENRQKRTHYRGTIAIHASSKNSKAWFEECPVRVDRSAVPFGSIVGFAELVEVITEDEVNGSTRKWFSGKFGYVLRNPVILKKPIPAKGERGVWKLKGKALKACLAQLTAKQLKGLKPFSKV